MTIIHIVLFKFRQEASEALKAKFVTELRKLKFLPCVQDQRLVVGGPSITDPIARSQGYHFCLLSYHRDREALRAYQASPEHHHVTSTYMWPFNQDLIRFDFEVDKEEDEEAVHKFGHAFVGADPTTPQQTALKSSIEEGTRNEEIDK